jgi:hypothetical protein
LGRDLLDPAIPAGWDGPLSCSRLRTGLGHALLIVPLGFGPASPAPDPPRDVRTADCGESALRSRRSWHRAPSRRESAVPTAGAPADWSKNSLHDPAANRGPGSGTHFVGCAGISRPLPPDQRRPLRAGVSDAQSAVSGHRCLLPQVRPRLHDISDDSCCFLVERHGDHDRVAAPMRRTSSSPSTWRSNDPRGTRRLPTIA